jgi:hypothetical protein
MTARALGGLISLLLAGGAASAETFVIVPRDVPLATAPEGNARTVRGSRKERAPYARWRLVARRPPFVEIESVPETVDSVVFEGARSDFCVDGENKLQRYNLRFFVREKDLAPVLTRRFDALGADGTGLRFHAGTPATYGPLQKKKPPAGALGDSFERPDSARERKVERVEGTVGGKKTVLKGATVTAVKAGRDGGLVTVQQGCHEVVVKVRDLRAALAPAPTDDAIGGLGLGGMGAELRALAALELETGGAIGSTRDRLSVASLPELVEEERRICWSVPMAEPLRVCAAHDDVQQPLAAPPPPPPPRAPPTLGWPEVSNLDGRELKGEAYAKPSPDAEVFAALEARGEDAMVSVGYKVCVAPDGTVAAVIITRPSRVPKYDRLLASYIERTWRYAPARGGGGVCTRFSTMFSPPIEIDLGR